MALAARLGGGRGVTYEGGGVTGYDRFKASSPKNAARLAREGAKLRAAEKRYRKRCPTCGTWLDLPSGPEARAIRHRAGMTLREVAARFGVGFSYLSNIETGKMSMSVRVGHAYAALRAATKGEA